MCGISGILRYDSQEFAVGQALLEMARYLQHRGADSAGMAVFSHRREAHLQMALPGGTIFPGTGQLSTLCAGRLRALCDEPGGFSALVQPALATDALADLALVRALEAAFPGGTVSAMGSRMAIYKAVGPVRNLAERVGPLRGTHGISHLRLATESRIDPAHAQPFWGRPYADIAVTHNGHITNYHRLRTSFEARGYSFASHNDSEVIGVYLGHKMEHGSTFEEALQSATRELDGSFSFIAATATALGVARDPLATKPLLYVENDAGVTLASEPRALYHACGDAAQICEIKPKEARVWALA